MEAKCIISIHICIELPQSVLSCLTGCNMKFKSGIWSKWLKEKTQHRFQKQEMIRSVVIAGMKDVNVVLLEKSQKT